MKLLIPIAMFLSLASCVKQPPLARVNTQAGVVTSASPYTVLTVFPDRQLDELAHKYSGQSREGGSKYNWQAAWKLDHAKTQPDGQRTIELLEIACYADVMCHSVEYPLRIATHDTIQDNLNNPDVRAALEWVRTSYQSGLPQDVPDD